MAIDSSLFNSKSLADYAGIDSNDPRKKKNQLTGTMLLGGQQGTFNGELDLEDFRQQLQQQNTGYQPPPNYGMNQPVSQQPQQPVPPTLPAPAPTPPVGSNPISGEYGPLPLPGRPDGSDGRQIQMPPGNQPYQPPPATQQRDPAYAGMPDWMYEGMQRYQQQLQEYESQYPGEPIAITDDMKPWELWMMDQRSGGPVQEQPYQPPPPPQVGKQPIDYEVELRGPGDIGISNGQPGDFTPISRQEQASNAYFESIMNAAGGYQNWKKQNPGRDAFSVSQDFYKLTPEQQYSYLGKGGSGFGNVDLPFQPTPPEELLDLAWGDFDPNGQPMQPIDPSFAKISGGPYNPPDSQPFDRPQNMYNRPQGQLAELMFEVPVQDRFQDGSLQQLMGPIAPDYQYNSDNTMRSISGMGTGLAEGIRYKQSQQFDPITGQWGMPDGTGGRFLPGVSIGY
jgi:hypothetical protein